MKKLMMGIGALALSVFHIPSYAQGVFFNMTLNFIPSPSACAYFIYTGALYMAVNPRLPDTITGGGKIQALITPIYSISIINARPGYTVIVPALNEEVFCSAMCSVAETNCWPQCRFAVSNFYSSQKPTYAVPNGQVDVNCPTLNMSKYPYFPSDPWTKFPYTRPN
jgi:hypothetical protein